MAEIDDGVQWARTRLRGVVSRGAPSVWAGLAALGVADRDVAERALLAHPSGGAAEFLLAASFASVFGDAAAATRLAREWLTPDHDPGQHTDPLFSLALRSLADALRYAAPESTIAAIRAAAGATAKSSRPPGKNLPMVGQSQSGPVDRAGTSRAEWITALIGGEPILPIPVDAGREVSEIRRVTAAFRTDPDAAWSEWRVRLAAGLEGGPSGAGSWDASTVDAESTTAELLLALTHGLLGLQRDAPVGRIRIAPRLPSHLLRFAARGIRLGDASLKFSYERFDSTHRFTLETEVAAVPPLAVFEPALRGGIVSVRVDGQAAELDTRPIGTLTSVQLQLPVDGVRVIEIQTD